MDSNDAFTSTQAWSVTQNADGVSKFNPPLAGPNENRECLLSVIRRSCDTRPKAEPDGDLAQNRSERHEDHRPPLYSEPSTDSYSDEDDGDDWDFDWDYPEPPPYSPRDFSPSEHDQDDEYYNDPELLPSHRRRSGRFAADYDWSDEYEEDREPRTRRTRRRKTFTDDYDRGGAYEDDPELPSRRSRRRNTFAGDYDRGGNYEEDPEPSPRRNRRRDTYGTDYHHNEYDDDSGPPLRRNQRNNTWASEYDRDDRYEDYTEPLRQRGSTRRAKGRNHDRAEPPPCRSRRSARESSRDWMFEEPEERPRPARIYSDTITRHRRDRHRDDARPSRASHLSRRSALRARPERRKIWSLLRSFFKFTMT